MTEQLDRFKKDYAAWFIGLDETAKNAIDQMFAKHPEDMFFALTGEASPDDLPSGSPLMEVLNPEGATAGYEVMPYFSSYDLAVEPKAPEANEEFTVRWTDTNSGTDSSNYADQVFIEDRDTGQSVYTSERIELGALAKEGTQASELTVPGLPAGNYQVRLVINVDGSYDPNQATTDVGLVGGAEVLLGVGGFDPLRPSTPEAANLDAVSNASFYLSSINNTGSEAQAQENVALALESYAGALPTGLTEDDDLVPRLLEVAGDVRSLQIDDPVAFQQTISADATATAQVMQQVLGLSVTPADGAQALLEFALTVANAAVG